MRRVLAEEEQSACTDLNLPYSEQKEVAQAPMPVKKKSARPAKGLRWAILVFGSIGIFAALTPVVTGVPLTEWLQNADFKKAYSGSNIAFMRGMTAIKAGNLAVATEALKTLDPKTSESNELSVALFPLLIAAKDYDRLAQIAPQLVGSEHPECSPVQLGAALGKERGLSGALAFLAQNRAARQYRSLIIPGVFVAATAKELPALEELSKTLKDPELTSAVQTITRAYRDRQKFDEAWIWSGKLSGKEREQERAIMVTQEIRVDPAKAVEHIKALNSGAVTEGMRHTLVLQMMRSDLQAARKLAETITDDNLKKSALQSLESVAQQQEMTRKQLATLETLKPELQADELISLVIQNDPALLKTELLPRLTALAKSNPGLVKLHDDVLRYLVVTNSSTALRQELLARMLSPETRAALEAELNANTTVSAKLMWKHGQASATGSGSSLTISSGPR